MIGKQYTLEFDYVDEVYMDVVGFEGLYKVSNYGNVLGLKKGKFLKPDTDKDGYKIIALSKRPLQKKFKVHRLVYYTFFPDADRTKQINHLDKNKANNKLWNLETVTLRENNTHRFADKSTSSRYRGVTRDERYGVWRAQVQINKVKKHLGHFNCETAAYFAYLKALNQSEITNKYA